MFRPRRAFPLTWSTLSLAGAARLFSRTAALLALAGVLFLNKW
jgi:hypothetical protein